MGSLDINRHRTPYTHVLISCLKRRGRDCIITVIDMMKNDLS